MILSADYHTHTVYSHGKGSILDNSLSAKDKGLKEIGIADHGFAHPAFGLTKRKIPKMKEDCKSATEQTGVQVLLGVESNIIGLDGKVDLKPKMYDDFDIFLAGLHKFVKFKPNAFLEVSMPDIVLTYLKKKEVPKSLIRKNTQMFINVIKNNPVDIITHLNFFCFCDVEEVAKVSADYGTLIELNSKKVHLTDEELYRVVRTGVNFVIDSDAHTPDRVGEISLVEKWLERVEVPKERIMNIDGRTPDFRFRRYKEGR